MPIRVRLFVVGPDNLVLVIMYIILHNPVAARPAGSGAVVECGGRKQVWIPEAQNGSGGTGTIVKDLKPDACAEKTIV